MTLDAVLSLLTARGLTLSVDESRTPRIQGPAKGLTTELKEALAAHREQIIERLRPKAPRRIVLLMGGRDSEVERVLEERPAAGVTERARELAKQHPGRTLAVEWLQKDYNGERYTRYLWLTGPTEKIA